MRTLDVVFTRSKKFLPVGSWAIMLWQMRNFSHVAVQWDSAFLERRLTYQASHGMVHFENRSLFEKQNLEVAAFTVMVSDDAFKRINQKCIDKAGIPYAKLQLLGYVLQPIFHRNIFGDGRASYVCSEIVGEILIDLGVIDPQDLDQLMPSQLCDLLEEACGKGIVIRRTHGSTT